MLAGGPPGARGEAGVRPSALSGTAPALQRAEGGESSAPATRHSPGEGRPALGAAGWELGAARPVRGRGISPRGGSRSRRLLRGPPPTGLLWAPRLPPTLAGPPSGPGPAARDVPASWLARFARCLDYTLAFMVTSEPR